MKHFVLALPFLLITAICLAQEGVKPTQATENSDFKKAQIMADKEIEAMKKVAPASKKKGFNKKMTKNLAVKLGNNMVAQKKERENIATKLSQEDKAKLVEYAKAKASDSKSNNKSVIVMANDPGSVKKWCDFSHGRVDMDKYCTGVVEWCWDTCILPDQSKKHYEGPYACGGCFVW